MSEQALVSATPAAVELLREIVADHGPVMFHQSGGCCDGSSPMCYPAGEFMLGDHDVKLGEIDEITLDVHGTVIEHLDADAVEEAPEEEDDTPAAGPIAIAVDMNEPEEAAAPGSDNSSP